MRAEIDEIMELCFATNNRHFESFANLLRNHYEGIISHAKYPISTGRLEGINNRTKTLRRHRYGFCDTDYFFLKIIDSGMHPHDKKTKNHKKNE